MRAASTKRAVLSAMVGAFALFGVARGLGAQEPGAAIRVSVLTFGQGDAVFELFGHNALRIQDPSAGIDIAYNWVSFRLTTRTFSGDFSLATRGIGSPAFRRPIYCSSTPTAIARRTNKNST